MFQIAVIPGKAKDLDSFLLPIVDEIKSLGEHGLLVKKHNGEEIRSKVHLVMASGDIPQVTKFCHHKGHNAKYGCRICVVECTHPGNGRGGMYYQSRTAALQTMNAFVMGDVPNIFCKLPSFASSSFYGLDELHLFGQGIAKFIRLLIVKVNQAPLENTTVFGKSSDGSFNMSNYTFKLSKKQLEDVGDCIEASRGKIPVSFQGSWDNLVKKIDGARAVDFLDFLLYVVPTLIVPLFTKVEVRRALLFLVRGCAIGLQWETNESLIQEMEKHDFLDQEVRKVNISLSVFRPNNHYLTHVGYIIRKAGSMRAYSARSMERTIGRYSKLIKSRVLAGKNAGNLVERLSMRSYFNLAVNIHDLLDTIQPKHRSLDNFIELPLSSPFNCNYQLWSSFATHSLSSSNLIESVSPNIIITQLKNLQLFCSRTFPTYYYHK
ncbi:hypothetical protein BD770DRAFT_334516 [Pilaira anomala]|nr:hypothetical protein BD770DRAFT_334516 [Pilaira anomala]